MSNDKVSLGYWRVRGRAQVPRLLLAYTGALWEDVQYTSPEQWFGGDKEKLGFGFPNLPYLIDGDFKITESGAIIQYIIERSHKHQLAGKDIKDRAVVTNIVGVLADIIDSLNKVIYTPNGLAEKETHLNKIKPKIAYLQGFIKENKWFLGYLTVADFALAEISNYIQNVFPEEYKSWTFIQNHRNNFNSLPEIQKYYEQESSIKAPFTAINYANIKF